MSPIRHSSNGVSWDFRRSASLCLTVLLGLLLVTVADMRLGHDRSVLAAQPAQKPADKPADKPPDKPADKPADAATDEPAEDTEEQDSN